MNKRQRKLQHLDDSLETVPDAAATIQDLQQQLAQMKQAMQQMQDQIVQIADQLQLVQNRLDPAIQIPMFVNGSDLDNVRREIIPLPSETDLTQFPPNFPQNVGAFRGLTGHRINALLKFYGLAVEGNVDDCRRRLEFHLRIRPLHRK